MILIDSLVGRTTVCCISDYVVAQQAYQLARGHLFMNHIHGVVFILYREGLEL
jgi:hypothetical protein